MSSSALSEMVWPRMLTPARCTLSGSPVTQRVPGGQAPALVQPAVGAGRRHPLQVLDVAGRQLDAVGHVALAAGVVGAAAGVGIEQLAGDAGRDDLAGLLVLEAHQAAEAAAVAQAFPLLGSHLLEALGLPERPIVHDPCDVLYRLGRC